MLFSHSNADVLIWQPALQWHHNGRDGVSDHQPHDCLLNRLFRRRSKKTSKLRVNGLCGVIHRWPVNSPHKGPVTRKWFHLMTSSWVMKISSKWRYLRFNECSGKVSHSYKQCLCPSPTKLDSFIWVCTALPYLHLALSLQSSQFNQETHSIDQQMPYLKKRYNTAYLPVATNYQNWQSYVIISVLENLQNG